MQVNAPRADIASAAGEPSGAGKDPRASLDRFTAVDGSLCCVNWAPAAEAGGEIDLPNAFRAPWWGLAEPPPPETLRVEWRKRGLPVCAMAVDQAALQQ